MVSNRLTPPLVGFFNLCEEVDNVVGLAEVVLYVVILGGYAQFLELSLEGSALLKEAMHLSFYLHISFNSFRFIFSGRTEDNKAARPLVVCFRNIASSRF